VLTEEVVGMELPIVIQAVEEELARITRLHGSLRDMEDALSVLDMELAELRDVVCWRYRAKGHVETEAIRLAAMVVRFLCDLC
jgi:hypothetical protein